MTEQSNLSAQESLDLIARMIREAKGGLGQHSFYYLLWGWVVTLANLGVFLLLKLDYPHPFLVWLIVIPAWVWSMIRGFTHSRRQDAPTHLGRITAWMWTIYGLVVFAIIFFGYKINFEINPLILIVTTLPAFVAGIVIKFRPLVMGGILFYAMGVVCFLVPMEYEFLVGAIAVASGYLVPGYLLKKARPNV